MAKVLVACEYSGLSGAARDGRPLVRWETTVRQAMRRATNAMLESRNSTGQTWLVQVDDDGTVNLFDMRYRREYLLLAYADGFGAVRVYVDNFRDNDAAMLDALCDTLLDAGYVNLTMTKGWSDWYRQ